MQNRFSLGQIENTRGRAHQQGSEWGNGHVLTLIRPAHEYCRPDHSQL